MCYFYLFNYFQFMLTCADMNLAMLLWYCNMNFHQWAHKSDNMSMSLITIKIQTISHACIDECHWIKTVRTCDSAAWNLALCHAHSFKHSDKYSFIVQITYSIDIKLNKWAFISNQIKLSKNSFMHQPYHESELPLNWPNVVCSNTII